MSDRSKGKYWDEGKNVIERCTRVSRGCHNCRALAMDRRFHSNEDPNQITLHMDRLEKAVRRRKPTVYAIWNDLFHPDVPDEFIKLAVYRMGRSTYLESPLHKYLVLTKRPKRMVGLFKKHELWLSKIHRDMGNIYFGTSCEDQATFDERVPHLLNMPTENRFISLEPLLGFIYLRDALEKGISQVIVGCESGGNRRRCSRWNIKNVVDVCHARQIPCFVKQVDIHGDVIKDQTDPRWLKWASRELVWDM